TDNPDIIESAMRQGFVASPTPSDEPEGAIDALITSMRDLSWRDNSYRIITLHSNAGFHEPDRTTGATKSDLLRQYYKSNGPMLLVDVPPSTFASYSDLLTGTSHTLLSFSPPPTPHSMNVQSQRPLTLHSTQ